MSRAITLFSFNQIKCVCAFSNHGHVAYLHRDRQKGVRLNRREKCVLAKRCGILNIWNGAEMVAVAVAALTAPPAAATISRNKH